MTETTIKNYQERAHRTIALLKGQAVDGAHMALGITTEIGEMREGIEANDMVNIREEHGDCNWYIANECNIYSFNFEHLYRAAKKSLYTEFKLHDIVDLHKKELAYGKTINEKDLQLQLINLIQYLMKVADDFGFSYEESLRINIDKLYQRYPEKFTQEAALNRDLNKEHKILEG